MSTTDWTSVVSAAAPFVPGLLGGGLMGAVLTALVAEYRSRRPRIGRTTELVPVLRPKPEYSALRAAVVIQDGDEEYRFENLFVLNISLVNKGRADFKEFRFGVTPVLGDTVVYTEQEGQDRHHEIKPVKQARPGAPLAVVDYVCSPLNRGSAYSLRVFLVAGPGREEPGDVVMGSAEPVVFVDLPTMRERIASAITDVAIPVGPVVIRIGR